jgi:hypothetical protein
MKGEKWTPLEAFQVSGEAHLELASACGWAEIWVLREWRGVKYGRWGRKRWMVRTRPKAVRGGRMLFHRRAFFPTLVDARSDCGQAARRANRVLEWIKP